jgi:hypothetical protein
VKSNALRSVDQPQLPLSRRANKVVIPPEVVYSQPSMNAAVILCITTSGLQETEVCLSLGIDAGHWTRMRKGEAHFPLNKLNDLMDLCGNEAPLIWLANSRGQGLVMLKSESERQLAAERELRELAEIELAILRKYVGVLK